MALYQGENTIQNTSVNAATGAKYFGTSLAAQNGNVDTLKTVKYAAIGIAVLLGGLYIYKKVRK